MTNITNKPSNRGSYRGRKVKLYTLASSTLEVGVTDLGACVDYIRFRDNDGEIHDMCMQYDSASKRVGSKTYSGAVIGRVANRIEGAKLHLNGKEYKLSANEGANTLHGGKVGFDKRFFAVTCEDDALKMQLSSVDGDEGFPSTIAVTVSYRVVDNSLTVEFAATNEGSMDTVFAPTLHTYFNFGCEIYDTELLINADSYTPVNAQSIPVGIQSVAGTPFDFTQLKKIGRDINEQHPQLLLTKGYDHNFVLNGQHAATVVGRGVQMDVFTDLPGLQFYSGNFINVTNNSIRYKARDAFALEPQYFPNAVNDERFAKPLLKAGETNKHYIKYTFKQLQTN